MRCPRFLTICATAALASGAAGGVPAATTDAFAGIPDLTFVFYDVAGPDAAAIRAAIDAKRPVDPHDPAVSFDGATSWSMRWHWDGDGKGGCDLASTRVTYAATVTLPRLTGPVGAADARSWDRYITALAAHEAAHARYAYDHRGAVVDAVRHATCATASAAATRVLNRIVAHDRAYDVATRHGETQGATFP